MKKYKKIILIVLLILIIGGVISVIAISSSKGKEQQQTKKPANSETKIDIVMQDTQFITQINDIYYNFDEYKGKTIQIEGFPMTNGQYVFVGRYGPGCCSGDGYAFMEYEYPEKLDLEDEKDWIRVIGTIEKGFDEGGEYIYIKATSVEKLETRGVDRVMT